MLFENCWERVIIECCVHVKVERCRSWGEQFLVVDISLSVGRKVVGCLRVRGLAVKGQGFHEEAVYDDLVHL